MSKMFHEIGRTQLKIARLLGENKRLCQLLKNTIYDPLSVELDENYCGYPDTIKVVPLSDYEQFKECNLVVNLPYGVRDPVNDEFTILTVSVDVIVQKDLWVIEGDILRPFAILEEIYDSLQRKRLSSLGTLEYESFEENAVSQEITMFTITFGVHVNG